MTRYVQQLGWYDWLNAVGELARNELFGTQIDSHADYLSRVWRAGEPPIAGLQYLREFVVEELRIGQSEV